jgi:hypothetical protein
MAIDTITNVTYKHRFNVSGFVTISQSKFSGLKFFINLSIVICTKEYFKKEFCN